MGNNGYNPYQQNAVEHADPVKLVGMMYEGALRFIRRAERSIAEGDPENAHNNIMRAYAIVAELMATLNFEHGGEIAVKLEQCYDYILHLLKEANIKKEAQLLDTASKMLEPLLTSWNMAFVGNGKAALSLAATVSSSTGILASGDTEDPPLDHSRPEPAGAVAAGRKGLDITG